jgi:hypothetical protein
VSRVGPTVDAARGIITPLINVTVIEEAAECFRHLGGGQAIPARNATRAYESENKPAPNRDANVERMVGSFFAEKKALR